MHSCSIDFQEKTILDLGCAEGYLGSWCSSEYQSNVVLMDVVDMNRTELPLVLYDGITIPFDDNHFDVSLIVFVLHHTSDAMRVLSEAARVSKEIVVIESVFKSAWDLKQLTFLDKLFNRVRSKGLMNEQEEDLHFRKTDEWIEIFNSLGLDVLSKGGKGKYWHQQAIFHLATS